MWIRRPNSAVNMDHIRHIFREGERIMFIAADGKRYILCEYASEKEAKQAFGAIWSAMSIGCKVVEVG